MPYGILIELNGEDITSRISRFEISARVDAYCREMSIDVADPDLYDSLDFSVLPDAPALEILTRIEDAWVSQGKFFIEKPTFQVGLHRTETGLWGRSETARLGPPFAVRITKTWESATTFFAVCEEMCEAAGLAWDPSHCAISDFMIHARTFTAENAYPVEVIQELLELAYGGDAFLATDRDGHVVIAARHRAPTSHSHAVTDPVTVGIQEEPEWPDFGNRIRISSAGSTSGYSIQVSTPNACLSGDGATRTQLYARVTDHDGNPAMNVPVAWSLKHDLVTLDHELTNTQTIVIFDEEVRARSFYEVDLALPPALVRGVYAYNDIGRQVNFAAGGDEIDGTTVALSTRLDYCDQLLRVTYVVDGVAVNWATAGTWPGVERVSADVSGQIGTVDLYIENPCHCPPQISLEATPSHIKVGGVSSILATVEIGGAPVRDGRSIYMSIDSEPAHGRLSWTQSNIGQVNVSNEPCNVFNEIAGVSRTQLQSFPAAVSGVWRATRDAEGNLSKVGESIYAAHQGKTVNLTVTLSSETELLADYTALGAAVNKFDGLKNGTDKIRAWIQTTREAPAEAFTSVTVSEEGEDSPPEECCEEGLCVGDGTPCNSAAQACEAGKIWCLKGGVLGCFVPEECDECEEGKVPCRKGGEDGCFDPGECDSTNEDGGEGRVYGLRSGQEGCFTPGELDPCAGGRVMCFKSGIKGCYEVEECDTSAGMTEPQKCPAGTVCCQNAYTGLTGCWAPAQCKKDPGKKPKDHDKNPGDECRKEDGTIAKCSPEQSCCMKDGKKGCYPPADCDGSGDACLTTSCQENPTEECLAARFGGGLAKGCSCSELCENEFSNLGTTQTNDGASFRPIEEIVQSDHGLSPGTPEYDEKYDELKQAAMEECRTKCGDCETAEELTLTGSETATKPGGYQFTAEGGFSPYTWSVSGTGVTVDDTGYVTLDGNACGSFTVTVTDGCGKTASMDVRITNAGQWVQITNCQRSPFWGPVVAICYQGIRQTKDYYTDDTYPAAWTSPCGGPDCFSPCVFESTNSPSTYCTAERHRRHVVYEWRC